MYKRDIYLDIDDKMNNYIKSVELDSNSRIWHFHLTVDYQPLNLTGKTVKFMAEKPDKTNVLNDCEIIDAENGIVKVELTRQVNAVPGHVNCLLKIVGSDGYVLKTKTFIVEVSKTLSDKPIVSTNEFSALDEALGRVQNIDQRFAETNAQLSRKADKSQIGSPLVASSVSEMTDTTKIYVNTSDGNWYSFDGSQWINGGVYNSHGIANDSITPKMATFVRNTDIFVLDGAEIGGLNTVGTINATQTGMKTSALIPVVEGSVVQLPGFIKYLCFYNINGVSLASTLGRLSDLRDEVVTIPDDVHFIKVTWIINPDNADYRDDHSVQVLNINELEFIPKVKDKSFNKSVIIEDVIDRNEFDDNVYLEYLNEYKILMIYMKTAKNYYLGYNFRYMKADYNASNTSSNYDVWRLRDVKIYTKNSDDVFTKVNDTSLIHSASEWECAIKEVGASDFVGGSTHGDELLDDIVFMLDGVAYTNVAQINGQKCKELRIIRTSRLYRADTNSETKIATHYVDYLFKNNEIVIAQKVNWLVDTTCGISYLTMLGAKRTDSGVQITSSALKDGEGIIYDVSQDNYSNGAFDILKGCKKAYLWNNSKNGFKTSMSVEVLESNNFTNANFKFDNRRDYNKFYFDHCGNNFEVKNGDVWHNKAKYKIDFIGFF